MVHQLNKELQSQLFLIEFSHVKVESSQRAFALCGCHTQMLFITEIIASPQLKFPPFLIVSRNPYDSLDFSLS